MIKHFYCCLFLPVTLCAALCTDANISFKLVCIGNSVEVFRNVTSTFLNSEYILYKRFGNTTETIAKWVMQNISLKPTILPKYSQKVSLENGTILLQDFQASDETIYGMILHPSSRKTERVKLCALVPPTLGCKPNITQVEHFLDASLDNPEYCGTPLVSIRWMEYPGVVHINKSRIELPHGNDAGTYRACIEGENLNCVKNSSERDNCNNYTIGSSRGNTDIPQLKTNTDTYMIVVIVLVLLGVIGVILIIIRFRKRLRDLVSGLCAGDTEARQAPPESEPLAQSPPESETKF